MDIEFCKECAEYAKCSKKAEDCPYFEDEQTELNEKAKKMPRQYEKSNKNSEKSTKKPKTIKVSDEKVRIFNTIEDILSEKYNISVVKPNKMIEIELNGKKFKLDLIEQRVSKG